jgi:hypothetical protein
MAELFGFGREVVPQDQPQTGIGRKHGEHPGWQFSHLHLRQPQR